MSNTNVEAKTSHALAFKFIKPRRGIENLTYSSIEENISYYDKKIVINHLDNFFRSSFIDIDAYLNSTYVPKDLETIIIKY